MKFKEGDKVKIMTVDFEVIGNLTPQDIGKVCMVTKVCKKEREKEQIYILDDNCYAANFPEKSLVLAKSYKPKAPTHIVIWDEENKDPHQFFTSEPDAKNFMKELSEKSDVVKDSVILVAIKSVQKVSITKIVRLKGYKI